MEQQSTVRIITLKDLWDIFIHRIWIIFLAAFIAMSGLFLLIRLTYVPQYESTATLYILRQDSEQSGSSSVSSDFSLALNVVSDCTYLLKSHSVVDAVIDELHLDIPYEEVSKIISTNNPDNTRILEVSVKAGSPELAKSIVDSICQIGAGKIEEAMGFSQVNLYEYGVLNTRPCNTTSLMTYLLVGVITAVLVYSVFLVTYLLDDRIRSEEDVEHYLGLSILGDIPNADDPKKGRYGYYAASGNKTNSKRKGD